MKNLFLIRYLRDPGFSKQLCEKIFGNELYLKYSRHFIRREIVNRLLNAEKFYDQFITWEEWQEVHSLQKNAANKIIMNSQLYDWFAQKHPSTLK